MSIHNYKPAGLNRYSAKKMAKPINFICLAPDASEVFLIGDFNDWHPTSTPMKRHVDGSWMAQVPLHHGHHHYQFLIDGRTHLDPRAQGTARNERNEKVSLLAVS
jgi:1,4-alpha-glucan branching enzyme